MASKLLLSTTILLLHITLISPPPTVAQCPYACGNMPPATTLSPPSQTGNYNYPPPAAIYTPPSNVFPYNPPTPTFYGGVPPPPDPIVPWFPFYYKDPPRNPRRSSSAGVQSRSTAVVFLINMVLLFQLLLC
ncbi:hypothetical protein L1987_72951 [Smallanthus sonchifolius]|uniref:Uncharacterized protein n=1 Tax=Smallanthus sonchifolius TaxID=185202 RepID=A0ACB9AXC1_9ASTR|nr:hypothetical protein L1987_72951 [Smallanthus sonchifolius]